LLLVEGPPSPMLRTLATYVQLNMIYEKVDLR